MSSTSLNFGVQIFPLIDPKKKKILLQLENLRKNDDGYNIDDTGVTFSHRKSVYDLIFPPIHTHENSYGQIIIHYNLQKEKEKGNRHVRCYPLLQTCKKGGKFFFRTSEEFIGNVMQFTS